MHVEYRQNNLQDITKIGFYFINETITKYLNKNISY